MTQKETQQILATQQSTAVEAGTRASRYSLGEETPSTQILSPELAQTDPGQYLSSLFELAESQTVYISAAMQAAGQRGLVRNIQVNAGEFFSSTGQAGVLEIGAKPYPDGKRYLRLIGPQRRGGDHEKVGALGHELGHQILYADGQLPETTTLLRRLTQNHIDGRGCLTLMSTAPIYSEREVELGKPTGSIRGLEDLVELVGLYLQDPGELASYLGFLTDPKQQTKRDELGLIEITSEDSKLIYRTVERTVKNFLSD